MKRMISFILATVLVILLANKAYAVLLFHEDFNTGQGDIIGVPTILNNADNDWYGGRFGSGGGSIQSDMKMTEESPEGIQPRFAEFRDDAGILFNIDTLNYTDVVLDFNWRTRSASNPDKFHAGYFLGNITGFDSNRVRDLSSGDEGWDNWSELLSGAPTNVWQLATFKLPPNEPSIWVGFWMEGDNNDYGRLDNIDVNGNVIPEPATLSFLGLGLLGMLGFKRKNGSYEKT